MISTELGTNSIKITYVSQVLLDFLAHFLKPCGIRFHFLTRRYQYNLRFSIFDARVVESVVGTNYRYYLIVCMTELMASAVDSQATHKK